MTTDLACRPQVILLTSPAFYLLVLGCQKNLPSAVLPVDLPLQVRVRACYCIYQQTLRGRARWLLVVIGMGSGRQCYRMWVCGMDWSPANMFMYALLYISDYANCKLEIGGMERRLWHIRNHSRRCFKCGVDICFDDKDEGRSSRWEDDLGSPHLTSI